MNKCKIIIAENDSFVLQATEYILQDNNHRFELVASVTGKRKCFNEIEAHNPQIILYDIGIHNNNGSETIKELRARYPKKPIIVLCDYDKLNEVKKCFGFGVYDYILKPQIKSFTLCDLLERVCRREGIKLAGQPHARGSVLQDCLFDKRTELSQNHVASYTALGMYIKKVKDYRPSREGFYVEMISEEMRALFGDDVREHFCTADGILIYLINAVKTEGQLTTLTQNLVRQVPGAKLSYGTYTGTNGKDLAEMIDQVRDTARKYFFVSSNQHFYKAIKTQDRLPDIYGDFFKNETDTTVAFEKLHIFLSNLDYTCCYSEDEIKKQVELIAYGFCFAELQNGGESNVSYDPLHVANLVNNSSSLEEMLLVVDKVFTYIINGAQQ